MIEALRGKLHRRDRRNVTPRAALVSRQRFSRTFDGQTHLPNSLGRVTSLILKLRSERIAPEKLISGTAGAHLCPGAPQRALRLYKLIAVVAKERPIKTLIELIQIDWTILPRSRRAQDD